MAPDPHDVLDDHRLACAGFTAVVREVDGGWGAPSPCSEWDARGVLEHVIGFHDVLFLQPLEAKPARPKDDPVERWALTVDALSSALGRPGVLDDNRRSLLGVLTTDVLVHTWDLSKAIGREVDLDERLCRIGLERAMANLERLEASGMFASPVAVPDDAGIQDRLIGLMGRDPRWAGRGPL